MANDKPTQTNPPNDHQSLLTAAEIAPHLKLTVRQVYRLAKSRKIPAHYLGRSVRFDLQEVKDDTKTTPAPTPVRRTAAQSLALIRLQARARTLRSDRRCTTRISLTSTT